MNIKEITENPTETLPDVIMAIAADIVTHISELDYTESSDLTTKRLSIIRAKTALIDSLIGYGRNQLLAEHNEVLLEIAEALRELKHV